MRPVEEPRVEIEDRFGNKCRTYSHPAFGQIGASRVQGGHDTLYGSDFRHNGYVVLRIAHSTLQRDLSRDWHYAGKQIIEVALSESQWATMISSLNIGEGVPCTIETLNGKLVPAITPRAETDEFKSDMRARVQKPIRALQRLREELKANTTGLSQKKIGHLLSAVDQAITELSSNLPFVADSFDEHVEEKIEKAKQEVHGYMNGLLTRAGVAQLIARMPIDMVTYLQDQEDEPAKRDDV